MLWQKGWFETRLRLLLLLGLTAFMLYQFHSAPHSSGHPLESLVQLLVPTCTVAFCAMLGGAGITTQPPFQAVKGTHGSILFTLSLPVTRLRLLATRASIGWFELAGLIGVLCSGVWFTSPQVRASATAGQMAEYAFTLLACASVFYCISVLLATFLEDQWRIWGTILTSFGVLWVCRHLPIPARFDIVQAMSLRSPLIVHTIPWAAIAFAIALSASFLVAALKIAQAREY